MQTILGTDILFKQGSNHIPATRTRITDKKIIDRKDPPELVRDDRTRHQWLSINRTQNSSLFTHVADCPLANRAVSHRSRSDR
ncbi:hypothetical protein DSECCO2_500690 [anaerobic digester metagenome]